MSQTLREAWHEDAEALGLSPEEEQRQFDRYWPDGDPLVLRPVLPYDPSSDNDAHWNERRPGPVH